MKLATIRSANGHRAVRIDDHEAVETGHVDVVALLRDPQWRAKAAIASGPRHPLDSVAYAPVVPEPQKIICVGLNYRTHVLEMGHDLPFFPTLFAKFPPALLGAFDDIVVPADSTALDWEAELGLVVGSPIRHATREAAAAAIAGYTVVNDVTARDWQHRTAQWLQGKTFESTTPVGPWLVTVDPGSEPASYPISCTVDGETMQAAHTQDLVFDPVTLVEYISTFITLVPGDLIATGTPGGVGHARTPPRYLVDGSTVVTHVEGIGTCINHCRAEPKAFT
jgi:acylpyruvate hydrolase